VEPDPSLDALLELDGQVLVIDPETRHWVRFVVRRVPVREAKPHGLDCSLTLHGPDGERLIGFDNAHPVRGRSGPGGKPGTTFDHKHRLKTARRRSIEGCISTSSTFDHKHRLKTVRPYKYKDGATLLTDFWSAVGAILREKGIVS
jgi:hypothetical protein